MGQYATDYKSKFNFRARQLAEQNKLKEDLLWQKNMLVSFGANVKEDIVENSVANSILRGVLKNPDRMQKIFSFMGKTEGFGSGFGQLFQKISGVHFVPMIAMAAISKYLEPSKISEGAADIQKGNYGLLSGKVESANKASRNVISQLNKNIDASVGNFAKDTILKSWTDTIEAEARKRSKILDKAMDTGDYLNDSGSWLEQIKQMWEDREWRPFEKQRQKKKAKNIGGVEIRNDETMYT